MTAVTEVLQKYGYEIARNWQFDLDNAVSSGSLRDSIYFEIKSDAYQHSESLVLLAESHWKFVEYGRSPGKQPPTSAMLKFIADKPVIPSNGTTRDQLAYLLARKIGRDGIQARPFLQKNIDDAVDDMRRDLEDAYYKDTEMKVELIVKELR